MKNNYCVKEAFKDIFGTWVLENQRFDGFFDMPVIGNHDDITSIDYLALYSDQSEYCKTENTAVCFYEYDHIFDGIHGLYNSIIYENEAKLVKFRERFAHAKWIIAPDYSLFGDFPNALQINNVYRSRFCAVWLKIIQAQKSFQMSDGQSRLVTTTLLTGLRRGPMCLLVSWGYSAKRRTCGCLWMVLKK